MARKEDQRSRKSFLQLLEKLQQDSWQLELLISGFVIFLLLAAWGPLQELRDRTEYLSYSLRRSFTINIPIIILFLGWVFLILNLFLHVILRGLWISTIGLRYVSGEVDYQSLNYTGRFKAYLRKKIGSFDRYIERLENICSIIFAYTFLILFVLISVGIYTILLGVIINGIKELMTWILGDAYHPMITVLPTLIFVGCGIIYFLDFITLGYFKRKKWTTKWYLPIYRIMSLLTLSFLYRPIYYNLIDNRLGRWAGYSLVPYIIVFLVFTSFKFETHPYFPEHAASHLTFNQHHYDNLKVERALRVHPTIPKPFIENGFLELFIPYLPLQDDSILLRLCPDFKPRKRNRLVTDIVVLENTSFEVLKQQSDSAFQCLTKNYQVYVNDSLHEDLPFYLFEHPDHGERGLKGVLDIQYLERGAHQLKLKRQRLKKLDERDSLYWYEMAFIPFWKE